MKDFYDELSPFYHLIYEDWNSSIERQGRQLSSLILTRWGQGASSVLDVSCGIGTQSLGLAEQGFKVTGSDLSSQSVARAGQEAESRGLTVSFSVCDMRQVESHHPDNFDVVLSADNSIPHLLSDEDILTALKGMHSRLRPGGGCIITLRDYDRVERRRDNVKPYGMRNVNGVRYLIWQVWDFDGDRYDLSMYLVEDNLRESTVQTRVMRSRYYAISPNTVLRLMAEAGFVETERLDDVYFQPVLVGTKRAGGGDAGRR